MTRQQEAIQKIVSLYNDEDICRKYLIKLIWPQTGFPVCPVCGSSKIRETKRGYRCSASKCYKMFSIISETPLKKNKVSLKVIVVAMEILKKKFKPELLTIDFSASLGITPKTGRHLLRKIIKMKTEDNSYNLNLQKQAYDITKNASIKNEQKLNVYLEKKNEELLKIYKNPQGSK